MSYKIDKKHPILLKDICKEWPEELQPGDWRYEPMYKVQTSALGVKEVLGSDGLNVPEYRGVTAVFVGSTERGEFEGVYVTYGTFVKDKDTQYFPVIEYKRTGLAPLRTLSANELLHALTVTLEFRMGIWEKVPKSARNKVLGYGMGKIDLPKRMISVYGSVYVTNATDSVPDSQALWARIYEY